MISKRDLLLRFLMLTCQVWEHCGWASEDRNLCFFQRMSHFSTYFLIFQLFVTYIHSYSIPTTFSLRGIKRMHFLKKSEMFFSPFIAHEHSHVLTSSFPLSLKTEKAKEEVSRSLIVSPQATLTSSSINLLKNCVGSAVFSVPFRVHSVIKDFKQFPLIIILISLLASWATYNFYLIGEVCRITKSKTYSEAWSKSVSRESKWLPQIILTLAPIIGCLANVIVLTDVLTRLLRVLNIPLIFCENRTAVVGLLCSVILFPICTIKDLSGLKNVSLMGLGGQAIATIILLWRMLDGSYGKNGRFLSSSNIGFAAKLYTQSGAAPEATTGGDLSKWFVLASLLSYCFVAHYNVSRPFSLSFALLSNVICFLS
jgi:hypothetical protein